MRCTTVVPPGRLNCTVVGPLICTQKTADGSVAAPQLPPVACMRTVKLQFRSVPICSCGAEAGGVKLAKSNKTAVIGSMRRRRELGAFMVVRFAGSQGMVHAAFGYAG